MSFKLFTKDNIPFYFKQSMFPVGENYVRLLKEGFGFIGRDGEITIKWIFNGDAEVVQLHLLVSAIRAINKDVKINLDCPYFPGGRADRICEDGEGFGLKVYAELINNLKFNKVKVFDPHSDVTGALVNNLEIVDNHTLVRVVIMEELIKPTRLALIKAWDAENTLVTLISPDAGANKKIFKLAVKLPWPNIEVVRADKQRDTKTSKIISTEVYGDVESKTVFIVDDQCSAGGTFKALAKKLKEKGAARIILIVSHYEGNADQNSLKESGIDKVYCYNDFGNLDPNAKNGFVVKIN